MISFFTPVFFSVSTTCRLLPPGSAQNGAPPPPVHVTGRHVLRPPTVRVIDPQLLLRQGHIEDDDALLSGRKLPAQGERLVSY